MKMEISVPEAMELINAIREQPEGLFEMILSNPKETVGGYLTSLMETEFTAFKYIYQSYNFKHTVHSA